MNDSASLARAIAALEGLSVGDAFGEQLLHMAPAARSIALGDRVAPVGRQWAWTDDTAMALSVVDILARHGGIEPGPLADAFARRYRAEPGRGYGGGAHQVLDDIASGIPYDVAAPALFGNEGSCGNGSGMRVAPVGAYFADDLDVVVDHAARSAMPTHTHPDGIAGAIAVAVAAAVVARGERDPLAILGAVIARTPMGPTRDRLVRTPAMLGAEAVMVAIELGNGSHVLAADTVPFAVWCAATHVADFAGALWACCDVGGDVDTTCAIVGGIVVGAVGVAGIPDAWRMSREPLPALAGG